jgi:hypothetical protein
MTDTLARFYPIGTPGLAWGDRERAQWLSSQRKHRDYRQSVEAVIQSLADVHQAHLSLRQFATTQYGDESYNHWALISRDWSVSKPTALITGGVHGYETSGVHGALQFLSERATDYFERFNLVLVPCVSPWAYERIHRWNANAVDPNRSFRNHAADESKALDTLVSSLIASLKTEFSLHIDLHETTKSDASEFRPALAARDGKPYEADSTPDGFYLVADAPLPQLAFQEAIIAAVAKVTHIAEPDAKGEIIGSPVLSHGVIAYPCDELGLCPSITRAPFKTTTEVYPDSPRATAAQCNLAQCVAVCAALDYVLTQH